MIDAFRIVVCVPRKAAAAAAIGILQRKVKSVATEEMKKEGRLGLGIPKSDMDRQRRHGRRVKKTLDKRLLHEYFTQINKSDGFNVTVHPKWPFPLACFSDAMLDPDKHELVDDLASRALDMYNHTNYIKGVPYRFKKIKRAITLCCGKLTYFITFQAQGANGIVRTFRARAVSEPWCKAEDIAIISITLRPYWRSRKKGERKPSSAC